MSLPTGDAGFELVDIDEDLLVLNKPAGLLCVPGRGADKQDCLSARVQSRYPEALVVHRLDMATSGLVLMARHPAAQRTLSQAFASRAAIKHYEALVQGHLHPPGGGTDWSLIDAPIAADWPRRPLRIIDAQGQPSQTLWRVLAHTHWQGMPCTHLQLQPLTGRTHQLRVHLQSLGHPIVGDTLYHPPSTAPRLMLHACSLRLPHPSKGTVCEWHSPSPLRSIAPLVDLDHTTQPTAL